MKELIAEIHLNHKKSKDSDDPRNDDIEHNEV